MFVKFVLEMEGPGVSDKRGCPSNAVVPHREYILSADILEVSKVVYENQDLAPCTVLGKEPEYGKEMLILFLPPTGDRFVATHCGMFLMNNEGRTIDSLVCP